jgi:hypothetical protein
LADDLQLIPNLPPEDCQLLPLRAMLASEKAIEVSQPMTITSTRRRKSGSLIIAIVISFAHLLPAQSARLTQPTIDSFNAYVSQAEAQMQPEAGAGRLFSIDRLAEPDRKQTYDRLRAGEVIIEPVRRDARVPGGLIHHWRGLAFFPRVSLAATIQLLQSYGRYQSIYSPNVIGSSLKQRNGNSFDVLLRLREKKVLTVVLSTEYTVEYMPLDARSEFIRSRSTRIAEVGNPGETSEREKPVGNDSGFMWRLNSYWRLREIDGGTLAECESISLSRPIPSGLGWLVGPFVESVPRESLRFTLEATRQALAQSSNSEK